MHSIESIAAEIRSYCAEHPCARDSTVGISWWLASRDTHVTSEQLDAAIALLLTRGELVAFELGDGSRIYGCA